MCSKHSQFDCHWTFMWSVWYDNNLLFAFLWFDNMEAVKTDCVSSAQEIPLSWRKIECFQSAHKQHIWAMKLKIKGEKLQCVSSQTWPKARYSLWKEAMDWSQRGLSWSDVYFLQEGRNGLWKEEHACNHVFKFNAEDAIQIHGVKCLQAVLLQAMVVASSILMIPECALILCNHEAWQKFSAINHCGTVELQ